jgi:MoxR-like ATPase
MQISDMEENSSQEERQDQQDLNPKGTEREPELNVELEKQSAEVEEIAMLLSKVKNEVAKVLIGQEELVDMLLIAMLSGGNVLLEGVPGIAKTLAARALAKTISTDFSRIQFTPDLMPADILGTTVFNMKDSEFEFRSGPIFSNIILIDEVNRAPAKTQAALIEVMEERQVTTEGKTYPMSFPFFIIATQNPVEQEGTYKLPEAQMDRFLFRLKMDYPSLEVEKNILMRYRDDFGGRQEDTLEAVVGTDELKRAQGLVEKVFIKDELIDYLARIVLATRNNGDLYLGASPRASLSILKAAKAMALINGRNYVTPDDIKAVAYPVLNHRIILSHEREMEGLDSKALISALIDEIDVPR